MIVAAPEMQVDQLADGFFAKVKRAGRDTQTLIDDRFGVGKMMQGFKTEDKRKTMGSKGQMISIGTNEKRKFFEV